MSLLSVLILFSFSFQLINCSYWQPIPIKYVGDTIKNDTKDINFCENNICVADASRMGLWMNHTQNPCTDFYEFVCGAFVYNQALSERYAYQGLQKIFYEKINEQRRKVLAAKVTEDDSRFTKIAKKLFQKCVDSRYILKYGKSDISKFLKSIGGFPMIEGSKWNPGNFNKSEIFENVPYSMAHYFYIGLRLQGNQTGRFISIEQRFDAELDENKPENLLDTLRTIGEYFGIKNSSQTFDDFQQIGELLRNLSELSTDYIKFPDKYKTSLKDINNYLNHQLCGSSVIQLNWKKMFEAEIPVQGEVGDDFEIRILYPHLICDTLQFIAALDNRTFSNFFALQLLLKFRQHIAVYFHSKFELKFYGTLNAPQRFEQCTNIVRTHLPVAFTSLLIERFGKPSLISSATEVANRTVNLFIKLLKDKKKYVKAPLRLLESMKLIIGYPEEILDKNNIEQHYQTLNLTGDENFFELRSKSDEFNTRLNIRRLTVANRIGLLVDAHKYDWSQYTTEDENVEAKYDTIANIIYFPTLWLQEPYFHPDRPRYFQDATFGVFLGKTIMNSVGPFLRSARNVLNFDFVQAFYANYKKWDEEVEVKDQPLPGFLMSNQQMFWMALIHKNCVKLQPVFSSFSNGPKNALAYFSVNKDFQRIFGCDLPNLSLSEIRKLKTLYDNFY